VRNVNIDETKNRIIKRLMTGVKRFNEKHRAVAGIATFFTLLLIIVISFIFSCAGVVTSVFGGARSGAKKITAVIAVFLLLMLIYVGAQKLDNEAKDILQNSDDEAVNTTELEEQAFAMAEGIENSEGHDDTSIEETESDKTITDETESEKTAIDEADTEKTSDYEFSEDRIDPKSEAEEITTAEKPNFSETNLIAFMKDHPDVVGWIYFEDGHISYPIVHSEDNEEYRILDYDKEESRYGAIFLDYRSSGDFTDANSIVYGHNMKDGSMFGTLRAYRQDPTYYNDHQYFQIITPDKTYRYLIFEYMDVPENYVLYDYVAEAALSFVADAEPIRIKSYMDSDIVVNKDSKVVTLSTCTRKDDLQFVVLGVLVDEVAD
jgi:SrtB family sortase